ncbi:GNAT family protein [Metabacillus indicus]|uniref:GNAT family N-acetyltransferase n=1 Tax=Metabacillus indicus TaxID=246786 RepID=UPI002A08AED9|nr:GNAT family protein [Metabacillus indicus]MDX8291003.1 GNAT family protein [Metabacillus indicus]
MYKAKIDSHKYLAILEPRHAEELYTLIDNSRERIGQWLAFPSKTNQVQDIHSFIQSSLKRLAENNGYWAGVWYKDEIAGSIGFLYIDWEARKTEIGYWLGNAFTGKGLAAKSVTQMIEHAFNDLDLRKVEINAASKNFKSRSIPERLGYTQEGVIRNYEYLNNEFHDRVIYGLLKEEWKNQKSHEVSEPNHDQT